MSITKTILVSFLIICCSVITNAQTGSAGKDSALLKLNFTTFEGEKIITKVHFENTATHKIINFKTDQNGVAACLLRIGENFAITIDNSEDSYEYTIPDADGEALNFTFKYHLQEKIIPSGVIRLFNKKDLKDISIKTNNNSTQVLRITNDTVHFSVNGNEQYLVQSSGVTIKNNTIKIRNAEDAVLNYILYFSDDTHAELIAIDSFKSVINVVYKNLYDKPVVGDTIVVKGKKMAEHKIRTSANGSAIVILPADDQYTISLKYFPNVYDINIEKENHLILANDLILNYPSVKEFEKQKKEEAAFIARRDSIYKAVEKIKELKLESLIPKVTYDVELAAKELKKDPKFFEKEQNVVCAVLNRNKWPSRMIVTDVTGSMYPYMQQIALWHTLEMMDKSSSDYVFFNDGDNKPDNLKVIGKTGGIYSCLKNLPDSVIKTMYTAMEKGSGGDAPENDIEALLKSIELKSPDATVILIADNLSPVKDMALLYDVKVPVRVVLCGTGMGWVNTDYIELAYRTGGSIHTIEQDIFNLTDLHDNDTIKIAGTIYKFSGGRFFPLSTRL
ncbi:hypothetical protein [Ferruginibacter sp. SUN106]|uniref:hypothetical protein n=1 Tax=Ferruginibacter sp. SUN106 TaxID=2978348 RepID=UPI003D361512